MLPELHTETTHLASETQHISKVSQRFAASVPQLKSRVIVDARSTFEQAIAAVLRLGEIVQQIASMSTAASDQVVRSDTIAKARAAAALAQTKFSEVHRLSRHGLEETTKVTTELTYWATKAEKCVLRVSEVEVLARTALEGAEGRIRMSQQAVGAAQVDIANAESARARARSRSREMEVVAVAR